MNSLDFLCSQSRGTGTTRCGGAARPEQGAGMGVMKHAAEEAVSCGRCCGG